MDDNTFSPTSPKRTTRTTDEMRDGRITFRMSQREIDDLYRYARARKATMSYMIREALVEKYPDLFGASNRHIRKPRKPKPLDGRTSMMHSFADGTARVLDPDPTP